MTSPCVNVAVVNQRVVLVLLAAASVFRAVHVSQALLAERQPDAELVRAVEARPWR